MLDAAFILVSKIIEPQAVPLCIHDLAELVLQAAALGRVQKAFKDGILHPLSVADALLGDLPQALFPAASSVFTS